MIIQILDKLCILNNKFTDLPTVELYQKKKKKSHISNEVIKYLNFFEVFIHNRLNLLLINRLDASDYLFELFKFFVNREAAGSENLSS